MALCEQKISAGIDFNCDKPRTGGFKPVAWIFNKSDVKSVAFGGEGVLAELTLNEQAVGFALQQEGNKPFDVKSGVALGEYRNGWNNALQLYAGGLGADFFNNIVKPMADGGRFIVILEQSDNSIPAAAAFVAYGIDKGLQLADGANCEAYNETTDGRYSLPLEEMNTPHERYYVTLEQSTREDIRKQLNLKLSVVA